MKYSVLTSLLIISCFLNYQAQNNPPLIHPEWSKNATIYEVNVRQYTPEGTFKAFAKHLPQLKQLGVDIIWLMPINPIGELNRKGSLGSYYSVKDYKSVNPEFGTPEDFKNLVKQIHEQGMKVIIDWVANHTAWDNVWVKDHSDFFTKDSKGNFIPPVADWQDVIDLNYDNIELRSKMIDAMEYWIKEFDIDGYRCDVAFMIPNEFWNEAVPKLKKIKHVFMLAEANENFLHQYFDMTYNWQLKDLMNEIAQGKKKASELVRLFETESKQYTRNDYRMNFTSNHDLNSWDGTEYERLGNGAEAFAVLCGVVPGMPLIYSGQEAAINKRLRFFDKDTIMWKKHNMLDLYTKLNLLKKKNKALWNGAYGSELKSVLSDNENVFSFTREKGINRLFAIFNFSGQPQKVKLERNTINHNYIEYFTSVKKKFSSDQFEITLQPWQYLIYTK